MFTPKGITRSSRFDPITGGGRREAAETMQRNSAPVTKIDGRDVVELCRSNKAVQVEADGIRTWFPFKALEWFGPDAGEYLIAKWFRKS